jgi:hypothetical protein
MPTANEAREREMRLVHQVVKIFDDGACSMSAEPDIPKPTR